MSGPIKTARATDKKFLSICVAVRKAMETRFKRNPTLRNKCSLATVAVAMVAERQKIHVDVAGGIFSSTVFIGKPVFGNPEHISIARQRQEVVPHAWIVCSNNYVDLTLTQFDPSAPKVAVLQLDDQRYSGKIEPLEFMCAVLPLCGVGDDDLHEILKMVEKRA